MGYLLDSNVLIAALISGHVQHEPAQRWLAATDEPFATCPITEGALVRDVLRGGDSVETAMHLIGAMTKHERHQFWPDQISYLEVKLDGIVGHRQVTDAYLAELARHHKARLATFDKGLASLHSDVAELVPTS